MARTLEQIDRELAALQAEIAVMRRPRSSPIDEIAGCFRGDEEWAAIMDEIEAQRKNADPGCSEDVGEVAA